MTAKNRIAPPYYPLADIQNFPELFTTGEIVVDSATGEPYYKNPVLNKMVPWSGTSTTPPTLQSLGAIRHEYNATRDPLPTDDSVIDPLVDETVPYWGFSVGSTWYNTLTQQLFWCADATEGAAVWRTDVYKIWLDPDDVTGDDNYAAIVAGIAGAKTYGTTAISLHPAGIAAYCNGTIKLAGPHTGLDGDNGSGDLIEGMTLLANGCTLAVPPSPTLGNFEYVRSPVLDGAGDYKLCSEHWVGDSEPHEYQVGLNNPTEVADTAFSADGSDYIYTTAIPLGMGKVNGTTFTPLLKVARLDYDGETVAPTGTTAVGATSGASARVVRIVDNGTTGELWLTSIKGTFQNNETVNLFDLAGAAAGTVVANGTINLEPTAIADGEWCENASGTGIRVGTKASGDNFILATDDRGNICDQGGRLYDYRLFFDLCGWSKVNVIGGLTLEDESSAMMQLWGTSRQGPSDSGTAKSGGRGTYCQRLTLKGAGIAMANNPIGSAVWDGSTLVNEDGQIPTFSDSLYERVFIDTCVKPFMFSQNRADNLRINHWKVDDHSARGTVHGTNVSWGELRGTFKSGNLHAYHNEPAMEFTSADVNQFGVTYYHNTGTDTVAEQQGCYGFIRMSKTTGNIKLKIDHNPVRDDLGVGIILDNFSNGFSRGGAQMLTIEDHQNNDSGIGNLTHLVGIVTHGYTGGTRDRRQIFYKANFDDNSPTRGAIKVLSGTDTTDDFIRVDMSNLHANYRIVAGTLVTCDGNGLRQNLAATTNPTATDDSSKHYGVGSPWVNTTLDLAWECVDATAGAAVWKRLNDTGTTAYSGAGPHELVENDKYTRMVTVSHSSAVVLNVDYSGITWVAGDEINILNIGAGALTIQGGGTSAVTISKAVDQTAVLQQHKAATLRFTSGTAATLFGGMDAV